MERERERPHAPKKKRKNKERERGGERERESRLEIAPLGGGPAAGSFRFEGPGYVFVFDEEAVILGDKPSSCGLSNNALRSCMLKQRGLLCT